MKSRCNIHYSIHSGIPVVGIHFYESEAGEDASNTPQNRDTCVEMYIIFWRLLKDVIGSKWRLSSSRSSSSSAPFQLAFLFQAFSTSAHLQLLSISLSMDHQTRRTHKIDAMPSLMDQMRSSNLSMENDCISALNGTNHQKTFWIPAK